MIQILGKERIKLVLLLEVQLGSSRLHPLIPKENGPQYLVEIFTEVKTSHVKGFLFE